MRLNNLSDLYVGTLKDLYSAEQQIITALPKTVSAASSPDLKRGLQDHLDQTKRQVDRLQQIFTEEKSTDEKLTTLAESGINIQAKQP